MEMNVFRIKVHLEKLAKSVLFTEDLKNLQTQWNDTSYIECYDILPKSIIQRCESKENLETAILTKGLLRVGLT